MTDTIDDLRKRAEEWLADKPSKPDWAGEEELIRDLWAWGQEQAAEANAWKHANAMEPVTAEELTHALGNKPSFTLEVWVKAMLDELGPLYRQRKT
jgi:hypothetical protein